MGNRAIALRESLHLTQQEFAEKLGLARSSWSEVENGRRALQDRHIKLIKAAFPQVSEAWLRDGSGEMFVKDNISDLLYKWNLEECCRDVLTAFAEFEPEQQQYILRFIQQVVARLSAEYGRIDQKPQKAEQNAPKTDQERGESTDFGENSAHGGSDPDLSDEDQAEIEKRVAAYREALLEQKKTVSQVLQSLDSSRRQA